MGAVSGRRWWHRVPPRALLSGVRSRLRGRDLALIAAGLTFYAGIAVVPLLLLSVSLTAAFSSPEEVHALGGRLASLFPSGAGAPSAVAELFGAGVARRGWGVLLALLPLSLSGEGGGRGARAVRPPGGGFPTPRGPLLPPRPVGANP